jgi:hypothetical protein
MMLFVVVIVVVAVVVVCKTEGRVIQGYGLSPVGFPIDYNNLLEFYGDIETFSSTTTPGCLWNGLWRDSKDKSGYIPEGAKLNPTYSSPYKFVDINGMSFFDGVNVYLDTNSNPENSWANTNARQLFVSMLEDYVNDYTVSYLFLGNEIDEYHTSHEQDYIRWIEVYKEAYDAIKAVSPSTQVGTNFQYERMAGIGVLNGWTEENFEPLLLHDMSKLDFIGLTVYPFFAYASPLEIPFNYLHNITRHLPPNKPIIITESGWAGINTFTTPVPWEIGKQQQVDASSRIFAVARMSSNPVTMINWLFVNAMVKTTDPPSTVHNLFATVSLRDDKGVSFPVESVFLNEETPVCPATSVKPIFPMTTACSKFGQGACCTAEDASRYDPTFIPNNETDVCINYSSFECVEKLKLLDCRYCSPSFDLYFLGRNPLHRIDKICKSFWLTVYETCKQQPTCGSANGCTTQTACVPLINIYPTSDDYMNNYVSSLENVIVVDTTTSPSEPCYNGN